MIKHIKLKQGLTSVKQAIEVRKKITELYQKYHEFSGIAGTSAGIKHWDFKRSVDALYYLGGGWPSPNSKGRMEALLDNFIGMYRVLDFIGMGETVTKYLAEQGVTISLDPRFAIDDRELTPNEVMYLEKTIGRDNMEGVDTVSRLVLVCVSACEELQGDICRLADTIKDGYRPSAKKALGVTDEEYDRLHDIMKFSMGGTPKGDDKATKKKVEVAQSVSNFNQAMGVVAEIAVT